MNRLKNYAVLIFGFALLFSSNSWARLDLKDQIQNLNKTILGQNSYGDPELAANPSPNPNGTYAIPPKVRENCQRQNVYTYSECVRMHMTGMVILSDANPVEQGEEVLSYEEAPVSIDTPSKADMLRAKMQSTDVLSDVSNK